MIPRCHDPRARRVKAAGALLALSLLSLTTAPAAAGGPIRFGVRAGLNASAFTGEFGESVKPDLRLGPNVGLACEYGFTPALAFRGEVAYSSKGGRKASEGTDQSGNIVREPDTVWNFDYIEVPLLVRGRVPTGGSIAPFFELGPTVSFALRGLVEPGTPGVADVTVTGDMKTVDLGFGAGLGVEFGTGVGRLGLEARYLRGFSDLFDYTDNASIINQAWTLAVSWLR